MHACFPTIVLVFELVVVDELNVLAVKAAGLDARSAGDDELLAAARALASARTALDAATAHVLAELDGRGAADRGGGVAAGGARGGGGGWARGTWSARHAGLPTGAGRDRVRVARVLHDRLDSVD